MRESVEHRGIEVGRHHLAVGSDPVGQPHGDGAAPGAHLQAMSARADTPRLQLRDRARVEERLEGSQPLALLGQCVVVRVPRLLADHLPLVPGSV